MILSDDFDGEQRSFGLFCQTQPIFDITFDGSDSSIVNVSEESFNLGNHYFVTGEEIDYIPPGNDFSKAIDIDPTDFGPGIGNNYKTSRIIPCN